MSLGRWITNAPKNPSPGDDWLTPERLALRAGLVEGEPTATPWNTVDQLKGMGIVGLYERGPEASGPPAWALALHHPDGSRAWWTGGVRLTDGEFVPELGARDAAWRFATPEEAAETLDGFRQVFQPGPQLARLAAADLAEEPAGGGVKATTVKVALGRVYWLPAAGP